jgi:hypothetical protein
MRGRDARLLCASALLAVSIAGAGCSGPSAGRGEAEEAGPAPIGVTAEGLYGMWVNLSDGVYRVLEFKAGSADHADLEGLGPVYFIYNFAEGDTSRMVQRGDFRIEVNTFVNKVTWSPDESQIGQKFENEIFTFDGSTLVIESGSATSGKRTFTRIEFDPTAPPDWWLSE